MTALLDGWITKPLWDGGLGVIPVEADCALCPICGKRWHVGNIDAGEHARGRTKVVCDPRHGGCGNPFRLEHHHVR